MERKLIKRWREHPDKGTAQGKAQRTGWGMACSVALERHILLVLRGDKHFCHLF
jgi:hypothetical protein